MIVELAILETQPGREDDFREGLRAARSVVERAEGYRGSTFYQCVEEPRRFVLTIWWDSVDAHLKGFRAGPLFPEWRSRFGHLLAGPPSAHHYEVIAGSGTPPAE